MPAMVRVRSEKISRFIEVELLRYKSSVLVEDGPRRYRPRKKKISNDPEFTDYVLGQGRR